jgi:hypothetical protein
MAPEYTAKSGDFQAEYEGSIPFTRIGIDRSSPASLRRRI